MLLCYNSLNKKSDEFCALLFRLGKTNFGLISDTSFANKISKQDISQKKLTKVNFKPSQYWKFMQKIRNVLSPKVFETGKIYFEPILDLFDIKAPEQDFFVKWLTSFYERFQRKTADNNWTSEQADEAFFIETLWVQ